MNLAVPSEFFVQNSIIIGSLQVKEHHKYEN